MLKTLRLAEILSSSAPSSSGHERVVFFVIFMAAVLDTIACSAVVSAMGTTANGTTAALWGLVAVIFASIPGAGIYTASASAVGHCTSAAAVPVRGW